VIKVGIHCRVTLTKGIGDIVTGVSEPFHNLITTIGLNSLADTEFDTYVTHCHVGTGDTPVALGHTALDTFVAGSSNVIFNDTSTQGTPPYFSQRIKTWRFAAGTFNNHQIAEIGFSNQITTGNLFSRALVLTTFGDETTSWIRTDEWLDVVYDFRLYPQFVNADGSNADGTGIININGEDLAYTIRPANVSNILYWDASKCRAQAMAVSTYYMAGYTSTSVLDIVTNQPTNPGGSDATTGNSSFSNATYTPGSYNRTISFQIGPDALNADYAGLGAVRFHTGMGAYQMSFVPPLYKWYEYSLNFRVNFAWSNLEGL